MSDHTDPTNLHLPTRLIHSGYQPSGTDQPVVPPIHPGTIRTHPETGFDARAGSYGYARYGNPNRSEFETILATLENGAGCVAYSSGMAAIMAVFQNLAPGDHVVVCDDVYHGTRALLNGILSRWGLTVTWVDASDAANVGNALTPATRLVWLETPSNPMLLITDLREVARMVRARESDFGHPIRIGVDNTWATPLLQNPLDLGADLVMHSCTKYIGGHSDILAGAIVFRDNDEFSNLLRESQKQVGAVLSPFDSWMLVRSIKTLHARMRIHCENARHIANFLDTHPKVEKVFFPGLPDAAGHNTARSQMSDFGGMISATFAGSREQVMSGIRQARLFKVATSLGGVESLWEHRQSSEGPESKTPVNLVRMSVGIEDYRDLIDDIDQVLKQL